MRAAAFAALALLTASPALADGIGLSLDEVRTVTFPKPVSTVFVGNPAIADINMIDNRHAFVLGKSFGQTNIVALNQNGGQVSNTRVSVMEAASGSTVTVNRGAQRLTYSCTAGRCEPTPLPGDGKDAFDQANGQVGAHQETARKAAGG
jgi:hypothetical protein